MILGMPQDTTLKNRRRAWRRLLSRRRQNFPYMYSRWASGCPTTRHRTDPERRDTYCRNADFNFKSSQEEHQDAIGHDTHKPTPNIETPTKYAIKACKSLVRAQDKTIENRRRVPQRLSLRRRLKIPFLIITRLGRHKTRRWQNNAERRNACRRDAAKRRSI
jgi:hypothetical protein